VTENTTAWERPKALLSALLRDYSTNATLVARTVGDPQSALVALRSELQSLDSTLPLYNVQTLSDHMSVPYFLPDAATVLGVLGCWQFVLAAIGIYGVNVLRRRRTHARDRGADRAGAARVDVLLLIIRRE